MAKIIDSLTLGSTTGVLSIPYTTCTTAAATAAKVATLTTFALEAGAQVRIKFTYANSVANPTLNINGTGAKAIFWRGAALASTQYWAAGQILDFIYDGTNWVLITQPKDNNTKYTLPAAGSALGGVKTGGDVTITDGIITVNDDSHNHTIANIDELQTKLDAKQATITGAATTITSSNLTANRALISNGSGKVAVSAVTSTELGHLDGVTSAIQTQLNDKVSKSSTSIQTINGGLNIGGTPTAGTGVGRIMLTGNTNPLIGLQAIDADGNKLTPYYLQVTNNMMYLGPTSSKALSFDSNGNTSIPANLTVTGTITGNLNGNATSANKVNHTLTIGGKTYNGSADVSITAANLGIDNALHFIGVKDAVPTSGTYTNGDVILVGSKEYVYSNSAWVELGDGDSHALKTITIKGTNGLTGSGTLTGDVTLSHADTSSQASVSASTRRYITGVTLDTYGHVTGLTTGTETVTDTNTTYDLAASKSSTNENVKLNLTAGGSGSGTDSVSIKGTGKTTVTTDANGVIIINSTDTDTGATSVEVTGTGNAITSASYDSTSRKLTLTKGATYNNYTYTLPAAKTTALGGVKVSKVNTSSVTVNSGTTTSGRYYPVELNGDQKLIVNVPWTDNNTVTTVTTTGSGNAITSITATNGAITATKGATFATSDHTHKYVPLAGGTMDDSATLKFSTYGNRFITISGNNIIADMSNVTGGWAGAFASVKDPAGDTTDMLGWYGGVEGLTHIYMGGTYSDPAMKMTKDGQFTFKNTPKVGSVLVSLANHTHNYAGSSSAGGAATSANKVNSNLTIKLNGGTTEGTNLFTFNGSAAKTINITPASIGAKAIQEAVSDPSASGNATEFIATISQDAQGKISVTKKNLNTSGTWSGNAATSSKWKTARNITLEGDVTGSTSIDGSEDTSITTTVKRTVGYGTCATAAATAAKVVTITDTSWVLETGSIIGIKFSNTNTASSCTLNVNNTGAKNIWYNNAQYTSSSSSICGYKNRIIYYMYDGTYWVWMNMGSLDGNSNTVPSVQCETAAATAAKVGTCTNYTLTANSYVHINIRYANTYNGAITLNIDSAGAKPIYINGEASSSTNKTLPAGTYIAFYDGTKFDFRTDGVLPGSIAKAITELQVSGKVITYTKGDGSTGTITTQDTDTNTTYTFATGDNNGQIKVTPSSGSAYNVSVKGLGTAAYTASTAYDTAGSAAQALKDAKDYADQAVANLVNSAPEALDTLDELAAALGDDENFATTVVTEIGKKANSSISITAGNGLTGGGTLAASSTLNVGAGTGITVSDDAVAAKLLSTEALAYDSAAVTTTSGRVYPIAVDKSGYLAVNVPWVNTDTNTAFPYLKGWADTRNVATTPNDYNGYLKVVGIKTPTASGLTAAQGGSYSTLVGIRGWSDSSGGNSHEIAFAGNGSLYHRHGATTSWSAWDRLLTASTVSNEGVTLDWGTTSTIATIGGVDIKITMPANPDTNTTYTLSSLGGIGTISASGTTPLNLSASKSGTDVTISGSLTVPTSGSWFNGGVVRVGGDGVAEYGRYIDFHYTSASINDYDVRIDCAGNSKNILYLPAITGQVVVHTNDTAIGSATKPVYIAASGAATACTTYAGGTAVTLNNSSKAGSNASFYAPTEGGTANYVLIGQGPTSAPAWTAQSNLNVGSATKATQDGAGNVITSKYVTLDTAQTISGTKTMTGGLKVSGRSVGSGDDEGIIIDFANNGYAGLCLGGAVSARSVFYFKSDGTSPFWRYSNGSTNYDIHHPSKAGTIALTSDLSNYLPLSGGTMTGQIKKTTASSWIQGRDKAIIRSTDSSPGSFHVLASSKTPSGSWEIGTLGENFRFSYATDTNYNAGTNSTVSGVYLSTAGVLYGACWNDYAEYRISDCQEPGRVICENGDDTLSLAIERLQPAGNVISDTFGFAIGETEMAKTPIAVSGRVLVYPYEDRYSYNPGDAVCAAPGGTVSKMTREEIITYPERIIGTVSAIPDYETWGEGNVPVNGRIWIKVK